MFAQWIEEANEQSLWTAYSQGFHPDAEAFQEAADKIRELWSLNPAGFDPADLNSIWLTYSPDHSPRFLMEMIKVDQAARIKANLPSELEIYLERFPELKSDDVRVVSLAYAEFCAREVLGQGISIESFCDKYPDWRVSIRRQLELHEMLSIPSNELYGHEQARHFPKVGECAEHFELIDELGRGGSARVFLARDLSLARRCVALKISGDRSTEPEILARLDHDNIVPVLSVHDAPNGLRLICMPYRGDLTLDRVFTKLFAEERAAPTQAREFREAIEQKAVNSTDGAQVEGPEGGWADFPTNADYCQAVAWFGWKLAGALAHAHTNDVFHRDIKPANILISMKSGPQLLDFNMARDPEAVQTVEDRIRGGTLPYMAPEQLGAFLDATLWAEICEQADIYSLGLVLEEFLRGKRGDIPRQGNVTVKDQVRALLKHRNLPRTCIRTQNPRVPYALDAILAKATSFRPVDRYRSAEQFAEDLQRFRTGRPLKYAVNPSTRERLKSRIKPVAKPILILAAIIGLSLTIRPHENVQSPIIRLPGVRPEAVQALQKQDYASVLNLLAPDTATADENGEKSSTIRDLIRLIASIESNPGNASAEDQVKDMILRPDLNESIAKIQGLIGENRHLDFLPAFRDYCRLTNDLANNPGGNIEWQNLERRFMQLIEKWPTDIRYYGFTAHMASMRSDFNAARNHVTRALEILKTMPPVQFDAARNDFALRKVFYSHTIGMRKLSENLAAEAIPELNQSLDAIRDIRQSAGDDILAVDPVGRLEYLEIVNRLGLADSLFELRQYDRANAGYSEILDLLKKYEGSSQVAQAKEQLESGIRIRQDRIRSIDPISGLLSQEPR
jgi:serine/threonine protein kinase